MARVFLEYLDVNNLFICKKCDTHLSAVNQIISQAFQAQSGKAYLMNNVKNTLCGSPQEKKLITGIHTICSISCMQCETIVGWKYIKAMDEIQKYKQGKFVLQKARIKEQGWRN